MVGRYEGMDETERDVEETSKTVVGRYEGMDATERDVEGAR